MKRRVFFSFHYEPDAWRAAQVRNLGIVDGNTPVSDRRWITYEIEKSWSNGKGIDMREKRTVTFSACVRFGPIVQSRAFIVPPALSATL